jgi:hypothetical protein
MKRPLVATLRILLVVVIPLLLIAASREAYSSSGPPPAPAEPTERTLQYHNYNNFLATLAAERQGAPGQPQVNYIRATPTPTVTPAPRYVTLDEAVTKSCQNTATEFTEYAGGKILYSQPLSKSTVIFHKYLGWEVYTWSVDDRPLKLYYYCAITLCDNSSYDLCLKTVDIHITNITK